MSVREQLILLKRNVTYNPNDPFVYNVDDFKFEIYTEKDVKEWKEPYPNSPGNHTQLLQAAKDRGISVGAVVEFSVLYMVIEFNSFNEYVFYYFARTKKGLEPLPMTLVSQLANDRVRQIALDIAQALCNDRKYHATQELLQHKGLE